MIRKSLAFYFLTIFIGSLFRGLGIFFYGPLEWESFAIAGGVFLGSIFITTLFSFPALIIIMAFYAFLYFIKPTPRTEYVISGVFGALLIAGWMFLLSQFLSESPVKFAPYGWAYGVAAVIAGVLVNYLYVKGYLKSTWKDPRKVY